MGLRSNHVHFDRAVFSKSGARNLNIDNVGPWIRATWAVYGPSVAVTLVDSFSTKSEYGPTSPHAIVAKSTLKDLMGDRESPSEASNKLFKDAQVSIPGARSSGEPRQKGLSVD